MKHRTLLRIKAPGGAREVGTSDSAEVGRRVMTTPLLRKEMCNKKRNTGNTTPPKRNMNSVSYDDKKRLNRKMFYLFLSCSEFYLPALVGHTAALVNGPNHVISLVSVGASAGRGRWAQTVDPHVVHTPDIFNALWLFFIYNSLFYSLN